MASGLFFLASWQSYKSRSECLERKWPLTCELSGMKFAWYRTETLCEQSRSLSCEFTVSEWASCTPSPAWATQLLNYSTQTRWNISSSENACEVMCFSCCCATCEKEITSFKISPGECGQSWRTAIKQILFPFTSWFVSFICPGSEIHEIKNLFPLVGPR